MDDTNSDKPYTLVYCSKKCANNEQGYCQETDGICIGKDGFCESFKPED